MFSQRGPRLAICTSDVSVQGGSFKTSSNCFVLMWQQFQHLDRGCFQSHLCNVVFWMRRSRKRSLSIWSIRCWYLRPGHFDFLYVQLPAGSFYKKTRNIWRTCEDQWRSLIICSLVLTADSNLRRCGHFSFSDGSLIKTRCKDCRVEIPQILSPLESVVPHVGFHSIQLTRRKSISWCVCLGKLWAKLHLWP